MHNKTAGWVFSPRIDVRLFDASGAELMVSSIATETAKDLGRQDAPDNAYSQRNFVPPGEVAVFQYLRDATKFKGTYASHKLTATAVPTDKGPSVSIDGFKADKSDDGHYALSGAITNKGTLPCMSPEAIFGLYDASGKILKVRSEQAEELYQKLLEPAKSVNFKGKLFKDDAIADVKVWATCARTD
ncbi:MAG: hypothetical protein EXR75_11560 [Myxococcales bacterium]|nr:hypothetical protein [Myxococcales bacterium]